MCAMFPAWEKHVRTKCRPQCDPGSNVSHELIGIHHGSKVTMPRRGVNSVRSGMKAEGNKGDSKSGGELKEKKRG